MENIPLKVGDLLYLKQEYRNGPSEGDLVGYILRIDDKYLHIRWITRESNIRENKYQCASAWVSDLYDIIKCR